ncbi:sigma-70 family RNA polymerase sigma factor [Paragemmobacter straminiformis]|uniref:Sigma-70 family RNA polymerase sigma factor n=1 Tax=Paragemmobacter straminiformis TaxID=2045119 RepID=A0A842I6P9_9RHOB|nr:sigma-70 family RNA polymerase sigma factor [Gemmobacter straminiformis]MBC2835083.1 sigma-70 family RNA polymerase sigma factor [Gemmobacter straminiformis]
MPLPDDDWSVLMRSALGGDARAYARLLREVTPVLRGIVSARGRNLARDRQEDIVQEVLMAIHRKRHTWQPDLPVRPWLYTIARHKVIDAFRARVGAISLPIEDFENALVADDPPDGLAARDVAGLIGQLDRRSAQIVRAVGLEDEATASVGLRLGMSEGAVRVALHRAMRRLSVLAQGTKP